MNKDIFSEHQENKAQKEMEIQSKTQTIINEPIKENDKDIPFRLKIIEYNNKKNL